MFSTTPAIKQLMSELEWKVSITWHDDPTCIISHPITKTHTICISKQDPNYVDFLHELCHAWLCEKVHYLFGTLFFEPDTDEQLMSKLQDFLLCAQDWFVDYVLAKRIPNEFHKHIQQHLALIAFQINEAQDNLLTIGAAMSFAQANYYKISNPRPTKIKNPSLRKRIHAMRTAFLSFPPDKPSAENFIALANALMKASGLDNYAARLITKPFPAIRLECSAQVATSR